MRPIRRIALVWLPAVAYMGLIWLLSSQPLRISLNAFPFKDKGAHMLEYSMLGGLAARAVFGTWPAIGLLRASLSGFALAVGWGFLDELHQAFVPSRNADSIDLAADAAG